MMKRVLVLALVAALTACASAPKPPSCDGFNKRPINQQQKDEQMKVGAIDSAASYQCA